MVEKFKDNTPEKDRKSPFSWFSVTNQNALANSLSLEVTKQVIEDFSTNFVFKQVSRRIDNPDFIMKGVINKFVGKTRLTTYGIISLISIYGILTWYFGIPIQVNETEMELIVSLYDTKGELVGKYSGIYKDKDLTSIYNSNQLALPNKTNKSFSNSVQQIRDQILNDATKYEK